jgi:hypothetical protein
VGNLECLVQREFMKGEITAIEYTREAGRRKKSEIKRAKSAEWRA